MGISIAPWKENAAVQSKGVALALCVKRRRVHTLWLCILTDRHRNSSPMSRLGGVQGRQAGVQDQVRGRHARYIHYWRLLPSCLPCALPQPPQPQPHH